MDTRSEIGYVAYKKEEKEKYDLHKAYKGGRELDMLSSKICYITPFGGNFLKREELEKTSRVNKKIMSLEEFDKMELPEKYVKVEKTPFKKDLSIEEVFEVGSDCLCVYLASEVEKTEIIEKENKKGEKEKIEDTEIIYIVKSYVTIRVEENSNKSIFLKSKDHREVRRKELEIKEDNGYGEALTEALEKFSTSRGGIIVPTERAKEMFKPEALIRKEEIVVIGEDEDGEEKTEMREKDIEKLGFEKI